jgi:hypothetical protein
MPLVAGYDESTLIAYMKDGVLKLTGRRLVLVNDSDYQEAVNEVAAALGMKIEQAIDIGRVRALARREAWRVAMQQAAGEHHEEAEGARRDRQQIYDHCVKMFNQAAQEALALGPMQDDDGSTVAASSGSVAVPNKAVW